MSARMKGWQKSHFRNGSAWLKYGAQSCYLTKLMCSWRSEFTRICKGIVWYPVSPTTSLRASASLWCPRSALRSLPCLFNLSPCLHLNHQRPPYKNGLLAWLRPSSRRDIADYVFTVFLRTIEYYRGILFLTTNRVGHFDDAFISRIHVVIRYTSLAPPDRNRIWNQFFQKLENERGEDMKIAESARDFVLESKKMNSIQWNGREIRNGKPSMITVQPMAVCQNSGTFTGHANIMPIKPFKQL